MDLAERQSDGATLREHLQLMATRGEVDPRLVTPLPGGCAPLWRAFVAMCAGRRPGMGPGPLTMTDIDAWCRLNGVRFTPWELDTLLALDAATVLRAVDKARVSNQ